MTFHNGAPLTSAEVLWSLRRYMDTATGWRCLPDLNGSTGLARITEVAAPDPRTVTVALAEPAALFLSILARPDCGATGILHPSSVGGDGNWVRPVGTGPYALGEWRRGQYVELERFDAYAPRGGQRDGFAGGKVAHARRLRFVTIPDSSAAKAALMAGNTEVMADVPAPELTDLRRRADLQVAAAQTMGMTTPRNPLGIGLRSRLQPPSDLYLLGTDEVGRDVLSRLVAGAGTSCLVAALTVVVAVLLGSMVGLVAGFLRGWVDRLLMLVNDALLAFPGILLALGLLAVFGASQWGIIAALGLAFTPTVARIVRGSVLSIREREFVEASRSIGNSEATTMWRHVLPGTASPLIVLATGMFG